MHVTLACAHIFTPVIEFWEIRIVLFELKLLTCEANRIAAVRMTAAKIIAPMLLE
jgi:hypothetical protein